MRQFSAAIILALASAGFAQDYSIGLEEAEVEKMNEEAFYHYQQAMEAFDRINYDGGIFHLEDALEADPVHVELQFFTLARARDRAENYYSAASYSTPPENMDYSSPPWRTSEVFYDVADKALTNLVQAPSLSVEERLRLEKSRQLVDEGRASMEARDNARFETASDLVSEIRERRFIARGLDQFVILQDIAVEGVTIPAEGEEDDTIDPFALLPGQQLEDWLPAPPPPPPGQAGPAGFGPGGPAPAGNFGPAPGAVQGEGANRFGNPGGAAARGGNFK